jgi:hypothetical protein
MQKSTALWKKCIGRNEMCLMQFIHLITEKKLFNPLAVQNVKTHESFVIDGGEKNERT